MSTDHATESPKDILAGLFAPCPKCATARQAFQAFHESIKCGDILVTADVLHKDDGECVKGQRQSWVGNLQMQCITCNDTGFAPTPEGLRLLAFVKAFLESHGNKSGFTESLDPF